TIEGLVRTGEFRTLRSDAEHIDPERLLTSLPGVGRQLARRLYDQFGIATLEELERAAHDGRLAKAGVGPKRLRGLIDALAGPPPPTPPPGADPWRAVGRHASRHRRGVSPPGPGRLPAPDNAASLQSVS